MFIKLNGSNGELREGNSLRKEVGKLLKLIELFGRVNLSGPIVKSFSNRPYKFTDPNYSILAINGKADRLHYSGSRVYPGMNEEN